MCPVFLIKLERRHTMDFIDSIKYIIPQNQLNFLESLFRGCPKNVLDRMSIKSYKANQLLINANDKNNYVFVLLKGRLQAIEEKICSSPYTFTELEPIDIVGDFELFAETDEYLVTLMTIEESVFLRIPSIQYLNWMHSDNNALFLRTQMLMRQLSIQTQLQRQYLFVDNRTKFLLALRNECKKQESYPFIIKDTRESLASKVGCSVRTLNRIILSLQKDNIVSVNHGKILINKAHHDKLELSLKDSVKNDTLTLPK